MTDQVMKTNPNTAAIVPEIWSSKFYSVLKASLPFINSVDMSYEGEIRGFGDTVNISTIPSFSDAEHLTEGEKNDADAVTITGQQLVVNYLAAKDFKVTDQAKLQSLDFMNNLRDEAIYAIQKKMQATIISLIVPSAAAPDHAIGYDSTTTLALADILEAKELLDAANVPFENRIMVVGSAQLNDLFNITGFTSRDFIPTGSPLETGMIGSGILGFMPKFTTVVGNTSYFFHPSFMTMAVQRSMSIKVFDLGVEGERATRVNCDVFYGVKQLSDVRVVSIS